jgi:hypothetical protein
MNTYTNYIDPLNNVMLGYASDLNPAEELGAVPTESTGGHCVKTTFESDHVCFADLRASVTTEVALATVKQALSGLIDEAKRVLGESPKVLRVTPVIWVNEPHKVNNPYGELGFFRFSVVRNPAPKEV